MDRTVHLANTDFEYELAQEDSFSFIERWSLHPACLQLQFLPLLYAEKDDSIAVTALPDGTFLDRLRSSGWWKEGMPRLITLEGNESYIGKHCVPWGSASSVQEWASEKGMIYDAPEDWEMIRLVNSKAYSFRYTTLPNAALVNNMPELIAWAAKVDGEKVVKSSFGLSGLGNRRFAELVPSDKILAFCQTEWQHGRPVICEPWLDRVADFSTQWQISRDGDIVCIGATRFQTNQRGTYQGTCAGPEELLFQSDRDFLEEHKQTALPALRDIAGRGYFGYAGIDAMLYRSGGCAELILYPIVEINARQTMSLAVLKFQQRAFPHSVLRLSYQRHVDPGALSIVPDHLVTPQKKVVFNRQLTLQEVM